jgi:hypothetical protein
MSRPVVSRNRRRMVSYWPHAGIVIGMSITGAGVFVGPSLSSKLFYAGLNLITASGLFLDRRRKSERREE